MNINSRLLNVKRTNVKGEPGRNLRVQDYPNILRFPDAEDSRGEISLDRDTGLPYVSDGSRWVSLQGAKGDNMLSKSYPRFDQFPAPQTLQGGFATDSSTNTPYFSTGTLWTSLKGEKGQPSVDLGTIDPWISLDEGQITAMTSIVPDTVVSANLGSVASPFNTAYANRGVLNDTENFLTVGENTHSATMTLEPGTNRLKIRRGDGTSVYAITTDPVDPGKPDPALYGVSGGLRLQGAVNASSNPTFFGNRGGSPGDYYVVTGNGTFQSGTVSPGDEQAQKGDIYVYVKPEDDLELDYGPKEYAYDLPPAILSAGRTVYVRSENRVYVACGDYWKRVTTADESLTPEPEGARSAACSAFYALFTGYFNETRIARGDIGTGYRAATAADCFYIATLGSRHLMGFTADYSKLPTSPSSNYNSTKGLTVASRVGAPAVMPFMSYAAFDGQNVFQYTGAQAPFGTKQYLWKAYKPQLRRLFVLSYLWIAFGDTSATDSGFDPGAYFDQSVYFSDVETNVSISGTGSKQLGTWTASVTILGSWYSPGSLLYNRASSAVRA